MSVVSASAAYALVIPGHRAAMDPELRGKR